MKDVLPGEASRGRGRVVGREGSHSLGPGAASADGTRRTRSRAPARPCDPHRGCTPRLARHGFSGETPFSSTPSFTCPHGCMWQPLGRQGPGPEPPAQDVKPGAFRLNGRKPFLLVRDLLREFAYKSAPPEQPARVGPPQDAAVSSRTTSLCTILATETGPAGEISPEVLTLHHVLLLQFHPSPSAPTGQRLPRSPEYSRAPGASAVSSAGRHRIPTLVPLSISTPKLPGSPRKPATLKLCPHDSNPHLAPGPPPKTPQIIPERLVV